jgi:hypothetical protein
MKKTVIFLTLTLSLLAVACNKNQRALKTLEGNWEETSINGDVIEQEDRGTINFQYCKLKKDEWCQMSYTDSEGNNSGSYDYKVMDKGEVMVQRIQDSTKGSIELTGNIIELTDTDLKLEMSFFGLVTTTTYQKK